MALYFLILDGHQFQSEIQPLLADCWRRRSFLPMRPFADRLLPAAREFLNRYHADHEPLLSKIPLGLPFDRTLWHYLVGEVLWFSALEIPDMQVNPEAMTCLLAPSAAIAMDVPRSSLPPILQVHQGSRDLAFAGALYRPDHAGLNDASDVQRLAHYLQSIQPEMWNPQDLAGLDSLPVEEREEELSLLREWFVPLRALYARAARNREVIICESLC